MQPSQWVVYLENTKHPPKSAGKADVYISSSSKQLSLFNYKQAKDRSFRGKCMHKLVFSTGRSATATYVNTIHHRGVVRQ